MAPITPIADERRYYKANGAGINRVRHYTDDPNQDWRSWATSAPEGTVREHTAAGYPAFYGGPGVHWLTRYGLTDPLIARLPAKRFIQWRIGHPDRVIPAGYLQTLKTGTNQIADPQASALYEALRTVNSGPIFTVERFRTIWHLHRGRYDVDPGPWRYPGAIEIADGPPPADPTRWYGMDIEFKFDESVWDNTGEVVLFVKQARPHPGRGN